MSETVLVLGSGPIRIGQGIEFDYSCVHCVWTLREMGYNAILVNNNPETVSTDFDTSNGLYFEPVTLEDVCDIISREKPIGVVCQFGGQTAINLAEGLSKRGIKVLGTSHEAITSAEDREQFDALLEKLGVQRPKGRAVRSLAEAEVVADEVGYPVLVRPSFVLGGRAMEIVFSKAQLEGFYAEAEAANPGQPVLVDKYLYGKEAEVDLISDGEDVLVPGIMEHIERAGVHSGDSMAIYPPVSISEEEISQMVRIGVDVARELGAKGLVNIQFVIVDDTAYVLEVNPRGSRTVPFLSKVTGIPMVDLATRCMMGHKLKDLGYTTGLWTLSESSGLPYCGEKKRSWSPLFKGSVTAVGQPFTGKSTVYAIKAPVFSFQKLRKVEPSLGPEMKSTGEIMGIDSTYESALYKAFLAAGINFKGDGAVCLTVRDLDKTFAIEIGKRLVANGRKVVATPGTAEALKQAGVECESVGKIQSGSPNLLDLIMDGGVSLMINTPSLTETSESEAARIRRACIETGVPCVTSIDTATALVRALEIYDDPSKSTCKRLDEYFALA
ncbi:MAG: carbamoyl-phosphate synthase large subunit [Fimbriimonadaceae bacterium]|nr:carbamoyl-phosphate synthase large subunit [Fimbriimonadaceae bacterium]MCE2766715.1 carbamoyl-phosphate synthase large subunit [Fimbriimonadaceae bacterium]